MALLSSPTGYNNNLNTGKTLKVRLSSTIFKFIFNLTFSITIFQYRYLNSYLNHILMEIFQIMFISMTPVTPIFELPQTPIFRCPAHGRAQFAHLPLCPQSLSPLCPQPVLPIAVPMKTDWRLLHFPLSQFLLSNLMCLVIPQLPQRKKVNSFPSWKEQTTAMSIHAPLKYVSITPLLSLKAKMAV